jgi:hypothetical protein
VTAIGEEVDLVVVEPLEDPVPESAPAEAEEPAVVQPGNEPVPA